MPKLEIHLTEGFKNDSVEIRVNGTSVTRLEDVSTDYSLGLARTVELNPASGHSRVDVSVQGDGTGTTEFEITADTYLSIRRESGKLQFRVSSTEPSYF